MAFSPSGPLQGASAESGRNKSFHLPNTKISSSVKTTLAKRRAFVYNPDENGREGASIFNIGFAELLLILLVAFLVVGPKDLPKVARWLGRAVKQLRGLLREVKQETGWDEIERELNDTKSDLNSLKKDVDISADLKQASSDLNKELRDVQQGLGEAEKAFRSANNSKP